MDDDTTVQRDDIDEDDDGDGEEEEIRRASKTVLVTGLAEKFFARSIEFSAFSFVVIAVFFYSSLCSQVSGAKINSALKRSSVEELSE